MVRVASLSTLQVKTVMKTASKLRGTGLTDEEVAATEEFLEVRGRVFGGTSLITIAAMFQAHIPASPKDLASTLSRAAHERPREFFVKPLPIPHRCEKLVFK